MAQLYDDATFREIRDGAAWRAGEDGAAAAQLDKLRMEAEQGNEGEAVFSPGLSQVKSTSYQVHLVPAQCHVFICSQTFDFV